MSPYVYCKNSPILQIDPLGMESGKATYDPNSDTYNASLNEVTVTAPALYKNSIAYLFFGELAFGNRQYTSEHKNPYIWTNREINQGVKAEMQVAQAALMGVGTVGAAVKIAQIGWRSLKTLDIGIMAGKALGDAIGQFGGNRLKGPAAMEAALNVNILSSFLTGLGVDPFSASALSSAFELTGNKFSILEKSPEDYMLNTALGTAFGRAGDWVTGLNSYKSLTIGVQMRTALSTTPSLSESAAIGVNAVPGSASTAISTWLSK